MLKDVKNPEWGKTIAIIQSNYIPWKGYFDLMNFADELVIYDDCQYTKNDWRNRNLIKTANGVSWLTIPVRHSSSDQKINETRVADMRWKRTHWTTLQQAYARSAHFEEFREPVNELYRSLDTELLSEINIAFIRKVTELLGITTKLKSSDDFNLEGDPTEKLLGICEQCGASSYLSGPAAKAYFDMDKARHRNIEVHWMDYSGYLPYPQVHPPFEHGVSVLDLIFNVGAEAPKFLHSSQHSRCREAG